MIKRKSIGRTNRSIKSKQNKRKSTKKRATKKRATKRRSTKRRSSRKPIGKTGILSNNNSNSNSNSSNHGNNLIETNLFQWRLILIHKSIVDENRGIARLSQNITINNRHKLDYLLRTYPPEDYDIYIGGLDTPNPGRNIMSHYIESKKIRYFNKINGEVGNNTYNFKLQTSIYSNINNAYDIIEAYINN